MTHYLLPTAIIPNRVRATGQLVEHGDLLSVCKQAQEGLLGRSERERGIPNTLLITGSGVRVPHNTLNWFSSFWLRAKFS